MQRFEYLPHIADIRVKVESDTLEGLFHSSLQAMNGIILNKDIISSERFTKEIKLKAIDTTILLVDFLSDVLTESHTEKALFTEMEILKLSDTAIEARISGYTLPKFDEDIKAVTYHEAEVIRNEMGYWETMLIFDI